MAPYATPPELASYLQKDLDLASAILALDTATAVFIGEAGVPFEATAMTYSAPVRGDREVFLPGPVSAVAEVRLNGVALVEGTGYTLAGDVLYAVSRFGSHCAWPPDQLEVDLTRGHAAVTNDVKLAVLQIAAENYEHPGAGAVTRTEQIDDYSATVRYQAGTAILPGPDWREIAAKYRGVVVA